MDDRLKLMLALYSARHYIGAAGGGGGGSAAMASFANSNGDWPTENVSPAVLILYIHIYKQLGTRCVEVCDEGHRFIIVFPHKNFFANGSPKACQIAV